ncbi:PREDICTED: importin subunit beta-1-like, partial [Rhagoletis zephyria]|uniref:importin subunit beta-1-like n=1 Tax=Rhagoletis zephyria TaxID=28612 RepID=UPI0008114730
QNELRQAHELLEQFSQTNLPEYLKTLSDVLANQEQNGYVRMAAGLQLKNQLTSKDDAVRARLTQQWLTLSEEIRNAVKVNTLRSLGTETGRPSASSQCIAYIAAIELPHNLWPSLIRTLTENATRRENNEQVKVANLEAIGYICQEVHPELLISESNQILTAIINNMGKDEQSTNVRLTATNALLNSLEFTKANFDTEQERHFIMQVVCEATQCSDIRVQVAALQCLVKIMSLYYVYMEQYMTVALFAITLQAIRSDQPEIALQGIEFWSNVCDEEIELAIEASEAAEQGRPPSRTSKFYAKGALPYLVPLLLQTLTHQDEDADEDEWNPCKAASVCLILMATCTEDDIIAHTMPFITENISKEDWHLREAAMMSFGSILEGPSTAVLVPIVQQALPTVISLMRDQSVVVRDTTTWVLSKICEQVSEVVLKPEVLKPVLDVLIEALKSEPRVAVNACWALNSLSEAANDVACNFEGIIENPKTNLLSEYFEVIVTHLIACTDRPDSVMNNLRSSAYEALMEMIKNSPQDNYPIVRQTTMIILERLNRLLSENHAGDQNIMDLQSLLCSALQSVLRKMTPEDAPKISDAIMTATLQMLDFSSKAGNINEDALLVAGTLSEILTKGFIAYYPSFQQYLLLGLKSYQNAQLCSVAIGVVADLCHAMGADMTPYSGELMATLMEVLSSTVVQRKIKTEVLSVFGDIALAIGTAFSAYLETVLQTLLQATNISYNRANYELVEYVNELWESTLHAYTGIVQALKGDGEPFNQEVMRLQPHIVYMNQFLLKVAEQYVDLPDAIIASAAGLIGDLLTVFGATMLPLVEQAAVQSMFVRGKKSKSSKTRTMSLWVLREIKKFKVAMGQLPAGAGGGAAPTQQQQQQPIFIPNQ